MIYFSIRSDSIVHSYCGSLFVGHCTDIDLVEHYEGFVKQLDIGSKFLLHFSMDGLNVNFSSGEKFTQKLSEVYASFHKLGLCLLHPVHSAFQKGLRSFFRDRFHQQHQTVKVLENFLRRKELLIWTTFSLTSVPFLNFPALDVRITLP